ncbi:MAG: ISAs1 family transposase, partial [Gammaproteobacteria bacterium]|nr:ISAs1 family transposase [Gammaproteobacteria bacterium]
GKRAIYMVSAWSSANQLVLGQRQVDEKSNEITAIPKLLAILDLHGCIVTMDAMGCQTEIAAQIIGQGGDYLLALKGNQGNLSEDTVRLFSILRQSDFMNMEHDFFETENKGHGRTETRQCWIIDPFHYSEHFRTLHKWKGLEAIAMIHTVRRQGEKETRNTNYYISSRPPQADAALQAKREHWGVENGLHWVLDVAFREDDSRIRIGHADANMAVLRHMAVNLLKQETTSQRGIKSKRLRCGWDETYLMKVLKAGFH